MEPALLGGIDLKDESESEQESGDAQSSDASGPSSGSLGWWGFECCEFLAGFVGKAQQEQVRIERVMISVLIQGRDPLSKSRERFVLWFAEPSDSYFGCRDVPT